MNMKRVVITGMGCLTPIGNNVFDFWRNALNGVSGAGNITKFDTSEYKTKFACEVKDFIAEDYIERKELRKMDMCSVYALVSADEAIRDSGVDLEKIDNERCGVIFASGIGGLQSLEDQLKEFHDNNSIPHFSPFYITKMILNMPAGLIAIKYNLQGINFAPVSACASSNHAIISAYNFIQTGQADLIIAGGTEASITRSAVGGFNSMKALSTFNDNPLIASRPYDIKRDGFVVGEGAGSLILEEYEHAINRGATIHAEIVGGGMSSDAYHMTAPQPEGKGACLSMKNALRNAGVLPSNINYINTHGTSTPAGDIPELLAISKAFGDAYKNICISSTKSMTGHLLGAASAIEAILSVLSVKNDIVPPTINVTELDPAIPQNTQLILNAPFKTPINYALSNSFGFGGHNASVIFKKY